MGNKRVGNRRGNTAEETDMDPSHSCEEPFLQFWLSSFQSEWENLLASLLSENEREDFANREGFRTWRAFANFIAHQGRVLHLYVHDDAFIRLWEFLRLEDSGPRSWVMASFGPGNGSVPASLLRDIEHWYKVPKLTRSEFEIHMKKIAKACDELLLLLGQVSSSQSYGDPFARFELTHDQKGWLLSFIDSMNKETERVSTKHTRFWKESETEKTRSTQKKVYQYDSFFQHMLVAAGITPVYILTHLRAVAENESSDIWLPRKVKSKEAAKTFFIRRISETIPYPLEQTLLAEIVARIAETDCSADDVRKALIQWKKERAKHDEKVV